MENILKKFKIFCKIFVKIYIKLYLHLAAILKCKIILESYLIKLEN